MGVCGGEEGMTKLLLLRFLNLAFLESHMLARDGVVFTQFEFLGVARIFLGHVKKTGLFRAYQLDIIFRFSHVVLKSFCPTYPLWGCGNVGKIGVFVKRFSAAEAVYGMT